jgi:hypothetical protein
MRGSVSSILFTNGINPSGRLEGLLSRTRLKDSTTKITMAAIVDAETDKTDRANGGQLADDRVCRGKLPFGLIFRPVLAKVLRDDTGRLESDKAI